MNYLGNLEKHPQGEAITTAAKDIRSFHLRVLEVTVLVISESAGWLRLFLLLLYNSVCSWA